MCYFAGRAAPMGAVGGGVVAATFYNFNPSLVARSIPAAWELASPDVVVGARFAAADAALTRLLGPDVIGSADMTALAAVAPRRGRRLQRPRGARCTPGTRTWTGPMPRTW